MMQGSIYNLDFQDKRVLVRVDFNVPLDEHFNVTDDTRIVKSIPTLRYILSKGGIIILCSHLGRPKPGQDNSKYSLRHILPILSRDLGVPVEFVDDCVGPVTEEVISQMESGEVLILENLRFHKEETDGDENFAKALASYADIYINDAFGTAHRAHASTTTVAKFFDKNHKAFGFLMQAEIENGNKVINNPTKPVTAIIGGAKVSDKIVLLERLIDVCNNILIGGGMAYTFIKAKGGQIGGSICENEFTDLALRILEKAKNNDCNILLPEDSLIADKFAADAQFKECQSDQIPDSWMGLDIGNQAIALYSSVISDSKTILWNGPMGVFEFDNFSKGTFAIARAVADATERGSYSLIGGGDSVSAINKSGLSDKVSYVSTGGGAMLEFLEGKTLPGIAAILD